MHKERTLDLAAPLRLAVGRIGYPEEGLRLTIARGMPFKFNSEVKLSRRDCKWLVEALNEALVTMDNLP